MENIGPAFGCLLTITGLGASIGTPGGGKNLLHYKIEFYKFFSHIPMNFTNAKVKLAYVY